MCRCCSTARMDTSMESQPSLELGCRHERSTGEDSMALNLFESVLHLTQGHMIVSYVIADSMVLMSFYLLVCLHLEKKIGAVT